ncbi:unnamed protein product [Timema podura]|uniref:Uncharacterized protein n=1 Tax=Timema podura TaxID=61482 RepID=A0ABN7NUS2_TIMPD|nr:unnamed protein product [Timema podura]
MQLEQAKKECEEVKRLYIDICSSKEKLTHQLELEQKAVNDLRGQLNTETDKLSKVLKELKEGQETSRTLEEQIKSEQELVKHLKASLETERINSEELRSKVKELEEERDEATKNANERARLLYTSKVNEEIDKAKREALIELENDCQKRQEQHSSQVSELEAEIKNLRSVHAEAERNRQQLLELTATLHQQEAVILELRQKKNAVPEHISKMENSREPSRDACTSPIKSMNDDLEDARRECARGYAEKLAILESKHRIELDEMQEKIKDETVNFFAEEIRKMEAKHRAALEQYQSAAGKELYSLQNLIETKAAEVNSLKQAIQAEKINLQVANNEEQWKAKVESLTKELVTLKSSINKANNCDLQTNIKTLSEKLEEKEKQLEEERIRIAELIKNWSKEVQTLRESNAEINKKYQECYTKYKVAKKKILQYKSFTKEKEKHLVNEYNRIKSGYENAISLIQSKMEQVLSSQESVITSKVMDLENQIRILKQKLEQLD